MHTVHPREVELSDAWIEGDQHARWRSAAVSGPGTGATASGAALLEVPRSCRLPRHTDTAEEVIVVIAGEAEVDAGGQTRRLSSGSLALVPGSVPHEVRNVGKGILRFLAIYAAPDVVTTFERPVQPGGRRQRSAVA